MRRLIVLGTVAVFVVTMLAVAVNAQTPRTPSVDQDAGAVALEVPRAPTLAPVPVINCNPNSSAEAYINCLHKYLNKMAKSLNQTVDRLEGTQEDLYNLYSCLLAAPLTQYPGYLYGDPNAPFNTTGLDLTYDPSTEPFVYFAVIDESCVA